MQAIDKYPWTAYIGGVGSGKTHTLILAAMREMMVPGSRGLIGAPSYRMLSDVTMKKFFELVPEEWITKHSVSRNTVWLKNNAEVMFRSFDNEEALQGHDLDWFGGDEMGLVGKGVFQQMQARMRRPNGRHKGFIVGNPSGPTHWTYEYFVLKAQEYQDTYHLVSATSYENRFVPQSYTQEMEKSFGTDSLYYRRFVLGEFVAFEGAYWPNFNIRRYPDGHVLAAGPDEVRKVLKPQSEARWNFGRVLDFGFEHPFTLMWWVHDGHTIVFYDEYYKRHSTIREHLIEIKAREAEHRKWFGVHSNSVTWSDHDAQGRWEVANCTDWEGRNIGFECSPCEKKKFVMDSIVAVQSLIQQNRLYISERCKNAQMEIPSYRAKPSSHSQNSAATGKTTKEEPIKEKDDTCDCLRMAVWMELRGVLNFLRASDEIGYQEPKPFDEDFIRVRPNNLHEAFSEFGSTSLD